MEYLSYGLDKLLTKYQLHRIWFGTNPLRIGGFACVSVFPALFLTHAGPSDAARRTVRRVCRALRAIVFGSVLIVRRSVFCSRRTVRRVQSRFDHACGAFGRYCLTLHRTVRRYTPDSPTLITGPSDVCCGCGSGLCIPRSLLSDVSRTVRRSYIGPSDAYTPDCPAFYTGPSGVYCPARLSSRASFLAGVFTGVIV